MIARRNKIGILYITTSIKMVGVVACLTAETNIWHPILDHMSEKSLKLHHSSSKNIDLNLLNIADCILVSKEG